MMNVIVHLILKLNVINADGGKGLMQINKRGLVAALMMSSLIFSPLAESKQIGAAKSAGMSRGNSSSSQSHHQNQSAQPTAASTQQAAGQPQRAGVGSMVAAGVAGAAIGAVAANAMAEDRAPAAIANTQEEPKSNFSWLWIVLLVIGAFFIFRRLSNRKAVPKTNPNPFAPNNSGRSPLNTTPFGAANTYGNSNANALPAGTDQTNIFGQSVEGSNSANYGAAYTNSAHPLPDGTQPAAFLRQARAKFLHLQSMNNSSTIEEVRRYFTPDLYQTIRADILNNDDLAEFTQLNAQVIESTQENDQFIVSVKFSGLVSESLNEAAVPFTETWHFVKPAQGSDWLVAGIE